MVPWFREDCSRDAFKAQDVEGVLPKSVRCHGWHNVLATGLATVRIPRMRPSSQSGGWNCAIVAGCRAEATGGASARGTCVGKGRMQPPL